MGEVGEVKHQKWPKIVLDLLGELYNALPAGPIPEEYAIKKMRAVAKVWPPAILKAMKRARELSEEEFAAE